MPASKEKPGRMLADERVLAQTGEFFSRHAVKLVFGFTVVLAVVIVFVVSGHVRQSSDREKGDWLEKHFFQVASGDAAGVEASPRIDVDAVLSQAERYSGRPYVLYKLARWLFEKGGEQHLRQAARVTNLLRDEYEDIVEYQTWSQELLRKIEEERSFTLPVPSAFGPAMAPAVREAEPVTVEERVAADERTPGESAPEEVVPADIAPHDSTPDDLTPDDGTPEESEAGGDTPDAGATHEPAAPPDGETSSPAASGGEAAPAP